MLDYCQMDPCEHISMKFNQNTSIFIDKNARENVICEMACILSQPQCVQYVPGIHFTHDFTIRQLIYDIYFSWFSSAY